jgi:hypothetical protein
MCVVYSCSHFQKDTLEEQSKNVTFGGGRKLVMGTSVEGRLFRVDFVYLGLGFCLVGYLFAFCP